MSDVSTTSTSVATAGPVPARRTTLVAVALRMVAETLPRRADASSVPPDRRSTPVMVTKVPPCPEEGLTAAMIPLGWYWNPFASVVRPPFAAVTTTSPRVALPLGFTPAVTVITVSFSETMVASMPARVMEVMLMAAARIATPVMTTVVPDCPDDGSTDRMVDWLTYWKLAALVTVAPSLFVMTIGPDCVLPAPSSTTMEEDETACVVAAIPAAVTEATESAPPSKLSPVIVTRVPVMPVWGAKSVMLAGARNSKAAGSVLVRAPLSASMTMDTFDGAMPAGATTTTEVWVLDCTVAFVLPPKVAAAMKLPLATPRRLVPVSVTTVPAMPELGSTRVMADAVS